VFSSINQVLLKLVQWFCRCGWSKVDRPFPLLWRLVYTTACTTVQAVIIILFFYYYYCFLLIYVIAAAAAAADDHADSSGAKVGRDGARAPAVKPCSRLCPGS